LARRERAITVGDRAFHFLIAGYVYAQGKMAFDPNLSIADAKFHSNTGLLAYVRSFDFAGQSAKFDVIVPGSSFDAQGLVNGQPREREMAGLGDPRLRFSFNLFGAPRAVRKRLRELSAGSYRWREFSGFRAPWAIRQQQAAQPRQQSLVVEA